MVGTVLQGLVGLKVGGGRGCLWTISPGTKPSLSRLALKTGRSRLAEKEPGSPSLLFCSRLFLNFILYSGV